MTKKTFPTIMDGIHLSEGGYVNHPKDPGGETNMGIIQRTLTAARKTMPGLPVSVRDLTKSQANEIYRRYYWLPIRGDRLSDGVDYVTMDAAVNSGVKRGVQWTQKAVGVTADGAMGPITLGAVAKARSSDVVVKACDIRRGFLRGLRTFSTFGKGWLSRVARVEAGALKLAGANPMAVLRDADKRVAGAKRDTTATGVGSVAAGGGTSQIDMVPDWAAAGGLAILVLILVFVIAPRVKAEMIRRDAMKAEFST